MDLIKNEPAVANVETLQPDAVTDVAVAVDEEAYLQGWTDAMRAVLAAMQKGGSWKPDDYFDGWIDAVTLQPVDPVRLTTQLSRYARGYSAGAREYELAHRGGCDAE